MEHMVRVRAGRPTLMLEEFLRRGLGDQKFCAATVENKDGEHCGIGYDGQHFYAVFGHNATAPTETLVGLMSEEAAGALLHKPMFSATERVEVRT